MSIASSRHILDLPNEVLDTIIGHVSGGTEQTAILRNRSMPDFARLTGMRLSCTRFNECVRDYRAPEKSKIAYSTNIYPMLGLPSRTTNQQMTKEWAVGEEEGSAAGRETLQASTMNDAEVLVFFRGRRKSNYEQRDQRQDSYPGFEGDLIHYLKEWSVSSGNILENLTTIIMGPTVTFERSDLLDSETKVSKYKGSIDYNLIRLVTEWMTERNKTITLHGSHSDYQNQNCYPLVGVWHGTPVPWRNYKLNAHYVSLDQPLDHNFYWHVPAGPDEQTLAIVRNDAENVLEWQHILSYDMTQHSKSWVVSLYPVVDGSEQLVKDCQEVLDEVKAEFSVKTVACTFEGKVTSEEAPVEEPFGEWYR